MVLSFFVFPLVFLEGDVLQRILTACEESLFKGCWLRGVLFFFAKLVFHTFRYSLLIIMCILGLETPLLPPKRVCQFIHPKQLSPFPERLELPFPEEEILSGLWGRRFLHTRRSYCVGESRPWHHFRTTCGRCSKGPRGISCICWQARHTCSRVLLRQQRAKPFIRTKRLSIYNWNPGPRLGKEGAVEKQAIEFVDHELLTNRFHVNHCGGCAVLFNMDTSSLMSRSNPFTFTTQGRALLDKVMEGDSGWVLQGVPSRASFPRQPLSGQKTFAVLSCTSVTLRQERGIGKKIILAIRAVMLDFKLLHGGAKLLASAQPIKAATTKHGSISTCRCLDEQPHVRNTIEGSSWKNVCAAPLRQTEGTHRRCYERSFAFFRDVATIRARPSAPCNVGNACVLTNWPHDTSISSSTVACVSFFLVVDRPHCMHDHPNTACQKNNVERAAETKKESEDTGGRELAEVEVNEEESSGEQKERDNLRVSEVTWIQSKIRSGGGDWLHGQDVGMFELARQARIPTTTKWVDCVKKDDAWRKMLRCRLVAPDFKTKTWGSEEWLVWCHCWR